MILRLFLDLGAWPFPSPLLRREEQYSNTNGKETPKNQKDPSQPPQPIGR